MTEAEKNIFSSYRDFALKMTVICLIFLLPVQTLSQDGEKTVERSNILLPKNDHLPKPLDLQDLLSPRIPPRGPDFLLDSTLLNFTLDWTQCQIHRVDVSSPLEFILSGSIFSNAPNVWSLSASDPQPGGLPNLYFIENVMGQSGPAYGFDIPLTWEISLDGAPFMPMTLLPDNTLTTTFPPGPHTFQVRITGTPQPFQEDGYYHLQMSQWIMPEL